MSTEITHQLLLETQATFSVRISEKKKDFFSVLIMYMELCVGGSVHVNTSAHGV